MSTRFLRSLYEEHLEEISALYERRLTYLDDTEVDANDIAELEERIEAHLDALVVGEADALAVCEAQAEAGDPGEYFGALLLFCRQGRHDLLETAFDRVAEDGEEEAAPQEEPSPDEDESDFDGVDTDFPTAEQIDALSADQRGDDDEPEAEADDEPEEEEDDDDDDDDDATTFGQALTDALRFEAPTAWAPLYERALAGPHPAVRAAVAVMAARRGVPLGPKIAEAAAREDKDAHVAPMLWALGRLRERSASGVLSKHVQQHDSAPAPAAMLAMLRFGDAAMVEHVVRLVPHHAWASSLLAIAGGISHANVFRQRIARDSVEPEEILAAGLFGDLNNVPRLLELLALGEHADSVAQALYLLTGAPLFDTVLVDVDEIEQTDPAGAQPDEQQSDAAPVDSEPDPRDKMEIVALSQEPASWQAWWEEHAGRFDLNRRYRLGQLASPPALARTLHEFTLCRSVRQLAAEEIGLRYWPKHDLDVDLHVALQHVVLAEMPALHKADATIERGDGAWIFARAVTR